MISIFVVSHGNLADGLVNAMEMITGKQEKVIPFGLMESEAPEDLFDRMKEKMEEIDDGDGVLILTDLFGASPFNSGSRLYLESRRKIEVVTGVNLPMLVEIVINREGIDLETVFKNAYQAGLDGIKILPESLRNKKMVDN